MTKVYFVSHYDRDTYDDNDHDKIIGVYSTERRAWQAVEQLCDKPGFKDFPERWSVGEATLDGQESWATGFITNYPHDEHWEDPK
jgi:hypothetical protein